MFAEWEPRQLFKEGGIRDLADRFADSCVSVDVVDDGHDQLDEETLGPFVDLACHRAEVGYELARQRVVLRLLDVLQTLVVFVSNLEDAALQLLASVDADSLEAAIELLDPARPVFSQVGETSPFSDECLLRLLRGVTRRQSFGHRPVG